MLASHAHVVPYVHLKEVNYGTNVLIENLPKAQMIMTYVLMFPP